MLLMVPGSLIAQHGLKTVEMERFATGQPGVTWGNIAVGIPDGQALSHEMKLGLQAAPDSRQLRQTILMGVLTASTIAYGVFSVRFNTARGDSEEAAEAYREDVRQNGQQYVDAGTPLHLIPSYLAWEDAFRDAVVTREWSARMGVLTALVALFNVVDSATTGNSGPARYLGRIERPEVNVQQYAGRTAFWINTSVSFN